MASTPSSDTNVDRKRVCRSSKKATQAFRSESWMRNSGLEAADPGSGICVRGQGARAGAANASARANGLLSQKACFTPAFHNSGTSFFCRVAIRALIFSRDLL